MKNVSQVSEGLGETMGIDLKSLLAGLVGAKIAGNETPVNVNISAEKSE